MSNKTQPVAAQGASAAKEENKAVLTVVTEKKDKKDLETVLYKIAELRKAEKFHSDITGKIAELQGLEIEEGSKFQSLTIVDAAGTELKVYSASHIKKVIEMLIREATAKKQEVENYLLSASI